MRPISLTLIGFRGIQAGLARDEIVLEFAHLVGDAELIAIAGANGRGKTTVMDNLHPFPIMPSRAGADGLGVFSYYDHLCLPEAMKDLTWEHEGVRYRSQLVFRLGGKRKTESFLHVRRDDTWIPVQLLDGTVSDGKADTYLRCVEGILGSAETFFTSAFSAQGRRPLANYRNAEIKSLLGDLLGLDQIRDLGLKASETVRLIKSGLGMLRQQRAHLQAEVDNLGASLAQRNEIAARVDLAVAERLRCQQIVEVATGELARISATREAAVQTTIQRRELSAERSRIIAAGKAALAALDDQDKREQNRGTQLDVRIARRMDEARRLQSRLNDERLAHERLLGLAPRIRLAAGQLAKLEAVLLGREQHIEAFRGQVQRLRALQAERTRYEDRMAALEREAGQAVLKAEDLSRRFGLTRQVPCAGSDLQGKCQLLSDARDAKPLMPAATLQVVRLNQERGQSAAELEVIQAEIAALEITPVQLATAEIRLRRTRERASRLSALAAREGEIRQASAALARIAAELVSSAGLECETAEERAEREAIAVARASIAVRRQEEAARHRTLLDQLDAKLALLAPAFDEQLLHHAEGAVRAARHALEAADANHLQSVRDQQSLDDAGRRHQTVVTELAAMDARLRHVEQALGTWTLFSRCMSNDGIIALSIDDAGPTLTGLANDLLLACYGPRFTVSIKTQVETAKGEAREGFDILVHDAESGDCKSVSLMSGGERVYINECLTRAIALYLAQNSGRRYETLFSDETDGPLDPERKRMFIAMKREVLRLGGYRQEFFVSQTPELVQMADAVIDLDAFAGAHTLETLQG